MAFAADILERFDVEGGLGSMLGTAFGVDLAVVDDGFEPGEVFIVMGDDNLEVHGIECRGRGGSR